MLAQGSSAAGRPRSYPERHEPVLTVFQSDQDLKEVQEQLLSSVRRIVANIVNDLSTYPC